MSLPAWSPWRRAMALSMLTIGWNLVEGAVAIAAALAAGSVALFGFGVDSAVESLSAGVMVWRLRAERHARDAESIERLDRRARRLIAMSLGLLAVYILWDASHSLWTREQPEPSLVGLVLTGVSIGVMLWLWRAKLRAAEALGSEALKADATQTLACWWLSGFTLVGIGLNAAFGWWWADPVAALAIALFVLREAHEAWEGEAG